MAHLQRRGQGRWRARYRDPDGQERSRTFARRVDAERWLATVEADKARGSYVDPSAGQRTVAEYVTDWLAVQVHRPTTEAQVESHLRNHVLPVFGSRPIGAVRPTEVQAWVKDRSSILAPATVEVVYRYLSAIFRSAVDDRVIAVSPCRGIRLPRSQARQVAPLETEQVLALAEAMSERYRALVVFAAGTGVRQGEAFGLTLPYVDMLRRFVRVEQQLVLLPGKPAFLAPPKTEASLRTIPLPEVVLEVLACHLAAFPVGEQQLHASASETLDTYSHLWPDSEDRTRQAVDSVLGEPNLVVDPPAAATR